MKYPRHPCEWGGAIRRLIGRGPGFNMHFRLSSREIMKSTPEKSGPAGHAPRAIALPAGIEVWMGDITERAEEAIINAANSSLLAAANTSTFQPFWR